MTDWRRDGGSSTLILTTCHPRARIGSRRQLSPLLKELGCFHGANLFRDGHHKELVHGGGVDRSNAFGGLFQRFWQMQCELFMVELKLEPVSFSYFKFANQS